VGVRLVHQILLLSDQSNSSNNNQPQTLPKSGIFENLINFAIPGAILFLIGGGLKLFILK
jgi:hypothetical protein